jgi:hypothetical protein
MKFHHHLLKIAFLMAVSTPLLSATPSAAREWNQVLLVAIRNNSPNPPAHARNLFHSAVAGYDCWAAYDATAVGYLTNEKIMPLPTEIEAARAEAIAYAEYRLIRARFIITDPLSTNYFKWSTITSPALDNLLTLRYGSGAVATAQAAISLTSTEPAEVGKRIAQAILNWGATDGFVTTPSGAVAANYPQAYTVAVNPNLAQVMKVQGDLYDTATPPRQLAGNRPLGYGVPAGTDPNLWQPLDLESSVDQSSNIVTAGIQKFAGVQSLATTPFTLKRADPTKPWVDPYGGPSKLSTPTFTSLTDSDYKQQVLSVIRAGSLLNSPAIIDISPGAMGNNTLGTDDGSGHPLNPFTGSPYATNPVLMGDYTRSLAEFWADGPNSETPPGHWHVLAAEISEDANIVKKIQGVGPTLNDLEWDVKLYFSLAGATHDAACAAWSLKRYYSGPRPISLIRWLCSKGQSSDPAQPSYSPYGIPLEAGVCEVITAASSSAVDSTHYKVWDVGRNSYVLGSTRLGKIVVRNWPGENPDTPVANDPQPAVKRSPVRWSLGENWLPFQRKTFNTPAFPGYVSGHSTFSHAAASALTIFTGSPDFPGSFHHHLIAQNTLRSDLGPSAPIDLQWRTYADAADQAGQSRRYGGIHVPEDDYHGRLIGSAIGVSAFKLAEQYWTGKILEQNLRPALTITSATTAVLNWSSIRGMKQTVQCSPDLVTWTDACPAMVAYDTASTWTDTAATPTTKFYRVLTTSP